jgi:hypothetical protein
LIVHGLSLQREDMLASCHVVWLLEA